MNLRFASGLATGLLFVFLFIAPGGAKLAGERLVVHEWGTFTALNTADGALQRWRPLGGPSELPGFVYSADFVKQDRQIRDCVKCQTLALVRMETPVLYFYSDREINVSVKVDLPQGRITEWYPQARESAAANLASIAWNNITVRPNTQATFLQDNSRSHYYPARETDAAPLLVKNGDKTEHEKFLFYRGIGDFSLPISTQLADGKVQLRNTESAEIARVIVFENRNGQIGWHSFGPLKDVTSLERPTLGQPFEALQCELESALVAEGLYVKEAAAMVKTWRDSWFEEGLRVFYVVPRRTTERILPITLNPQPAELVRVLVGRAEIITPELRQEILSAVTAFTSSSADARDAAIRTVRKYGRFAEPVLREAMSRAGGSFVVIQKLTEAAAAQPANTNRSSNE
jgi:hypothetical protein